jgi:chaperonin cofactor prefoldin
MQNKEYYQTWKESLEIESLDVVEMILKIELFLYEVDKTFKELERLRLDDEPDYYILKGMEKRQKQAHRRLLDRLENLELDTDHCNFMIKLINDNRL